MDARRNLSSQRVRFSHLVGILAIPVILLLFVWKRKQELPFRSVIVLFRLFSVSCGTTHFMEIVMFYYPVYRVDGLLKFVTAIVSWATVISLIPAIPRALAMKSPDALEIEVRDRTAELEEANRAKDELLVREQPRAAKPKKRASWPKTPTAPRTSF